MTLSSSKSTNTSDLCRLAVLILCITIGQNISVAQDHFSGEHFANPMDCGYQSENIVLEKFQRAIASGEISDPSLQMLPSVRPRTVRDGVAAGGGVPFMTQQDLTYYEDTAGLLTTNFSDAQLFSFMKNATNTVLEQHGDNFDFIGFFLNFAPNHEIGSAFYLGIENDVSGIGQNFFNFRPYLGISGNHVEGFVMMWNHIGWASGSGNRTQLILGQEFEHRFAMYLNSLSGGRRLQGTSDSCGRNWHWNLRVDGQGSGMEIGEWVGSAPSIRSADRLNINAEIGGVYSYPDLYLMGYITPDELDSLPSELRYMNDSNDCSAPYSGPITTWGSSDIIASNGNRSPTAEFAQKDFRTAWVVVHLPEALPTSSELDRIVDILNDWTDTYQLSTLGRGTMDNTIDVPFRIQFIDEIPTYINPGQPTNILTRTINFSSTADAESGLLHFSIDNGPYQTLPLISNVSNNFMITLPAVPCTSIVDFYITIESTDGRILQLPRAAPATVHTVISAQSTTVVFSDDFNTDKGWSVTNDIDLTDGAWDRAVPQGLGDRGDPMEDYDGSGQCYLTNSSAGNTDVDGGMTTLTSPPIDLSAESEAILRYTRWYTNDFGADPGGDFWVAEISDDGQNWVELENSNISNAWDEKTFRVSDYVTLSDQVQIRFLASDFSPGSVVEAAVDAFSVTAIHCDGVECIQMDPVQTDPMDTLKSRFISFVPGNTGANTAIRVTMTQLDQFEDQNGDVRWVGSPVEYQESSAPGPAFLASQLQCEPHFQDWGSIDILHVYGMGIVPSSRYDVQTVSDLCGTYAEEVYSSPVTLYTGVWGDVVTPFATPELVQPSIADVLSVVDKWMGTLDPVKAHSQLQPNLVNPSQSVGIADVLRDVDAWLGSPYPFAGPTTCP